MAAQPRVSYAPAGDGRLAYYVIGDAQAEWVVWVQWVAQHLDLMWTDPTIEAMITGLVRDDLTSIVVQPRGTGLSDPIARVATPAEQAADLLAVLDAEGITDATVNVVGGATLPALLLAAQHPERVRGLVLYGGSLTGPRIDDTADGWTPATARRFEQEWTRAGTRWGSGATLAAWDEGLATPHNVRLVGMGERCSVGPDLAAGYIDQFCDADSRPIAPQVRVPTRVLGVPGGVAPLSVMRALAEAVPGATFHELPRSRPGDSIGDSFIPIARHTAELARGDAARYGATERVLASVVFTDIVGSTEELVRAGDAAWAATLTRYHQMVRREASAQGGRVVDITGDGTLCEFPAPAAATRAAQAVCAAGRALGVQTRAGVHVGECERIGADLAGVAVHVGARISALAGPGQVLVSQTVHDLVAGAELRFEPLGRRELKGVPGRWAVFALRPRRPEDVPAVLQPAEPTVVDRLAVRLAQRAPDAVRTLNRAGNALQRRVNARRRSVSTARS